MDAPVAAPPRALPRLPPLRLGRATDDGLASLVAEGNEAAFSVLFERFHQPLHRYCRALLGSDADAQDVLQTTFTHALVALREDRRHAPLRPWLYRIAHNESVSLRRRRQGEPPVDSGSFGSSGRSAQEIAEERARLATLVADLRDLPERQCGALVMRELSGLPHAEIALAFGISLGAAKQTVLEARRSLQSSPRDARWRVTRSSGSSPTATDARCGAAARVLTCGTARAAAPSPRPSAPVRPICALSPALPAAVASGRLARIIGAGSGHGGGGAGVAAGAATKVTGLAVSAKVLVGGAAIIAAAAAGAGAVQQLTATPTPAAAGARPPAGAPAPRSARPRRSRSAQMIKPARTAPAGATSSRRPMPRPLHHGRQTGRLEPMTTRTATAGPGAVRSPHRARRAGDARADTTGGRGPARAVTHGRSTRAATHGRSLGRPHFLVTPTTSHRSSTRAGGAATARRHRAAGAPVAAR